MRERLDLNFGAMEKSLECFKQSSDVVRFSCALENLFLHITLMLDKPRGWETLEETIAKTQLNEVAQTQVADSGWREMLLSHWVELFSANECIGHIFSFTYNLNVRTKVV